MDNKILISDSNLRSITREMVQDLLTKIKNKDLSLPYTTQITKSTYLKVDGNGNMFLCNNGKYIELGNLNKDRLDINKIFDIFHIMINSGNLWYPNTNYKSMPTIRYDFGCVQYNGKIYCVGGLNNNDYGITKIESYDITSNLWGTNYTNIPTGRYGMGVIVSSKGKIYCIGGYIFANRDGTNKVEAYDIQSNTWSTLHNMPTARQGFGCIEYNGKVYCIGGDYGGSLNKVEVYDITSNTWSANYTTMPTARSTFGCVLYNGKIYCIGGNNINKVEVYDITSNTWSANYTTMPTARYGFGCILYDGKIYCIGGNNNINVLNKLEVYDIISNTWSSNYNPMPTIRYQFGCISYDGKIYCIGGYPYINIIETYQLPYKTFDIPIPSFINEKLSEILSNGDGTKIFHNDGKYRSITPTYDVLSSDQVNDILDYAFL